MAEPPHSGSAKITAASADASTTLAAIPILADPCRRLGGSREAQSPDLRESFA